MRTVHNPQDKKKNQITRRNAILWSITTKSATIWGTGLRQEILLGSHSADPSVPRSTPLNDSAHSEQQFGRDDYARKSCSVGSCRNHNNSSSSTYSSNNYTYSKR